MFRSKNLKCAKGFMMCCRVLLGTVRCAAVGNKVAAFYYFMFAEAKKQHFLIKFTPAWSWSI